MTSTAFTIWFIAANLLLASPLYAYERCSAEKPTMARINGSDVVWTNCTADKLYKQEFRYPTGARTFPYSSRIFKTPNDTYPTDLTKTDLIWLATTIDINEPLRSFGGDIILVADTININAPIDSRIYIEHGVDHFKPAEQRLDHAYNTYKYAGLTDYKAALDGYYGKCIMCDFVGSRMSELPSGAGATTPDESLKGAVANDGENAPGELELDYSQLHSGSILIIAKSIHVAESLSNPTNMSKRADCEGQVPARVAFAINASGLDGGRGGTGSVQCNGHVDRSRAGQFFKECEAGAFLVPGGISGKGSAGADAGNITVLLDKGTDPELLKITEDAIKRVSTSQGGTAVRGRYQTPPFDGPQRVTPDRCSFKQVSTDETLANGKDGMIQISEGTRAQLLNALVGNLSAKDLRNNYDYASLLHIATIDLSIYSLTPSAAYSDYLLHTLLTAEDKHSQDVQRVFADKQTDVGEYLPWLFEKLTGDDVVTFRDDRQNRELLEAILEYQDKDRVMHPFNISGGLFEVPNDVYAQMAAGQLRVNVSLVRKTLSEINSELRDIDTEVLLYTHQRKSQELNAQIEKLQKAIADAQAEEQKASQTPGMLQQLANLKDLATAVAGLATAVSAGQYEAAAALLEPAARAYGKLTAEILPYDSNKVKRLEMQLREVDTEFAAFGGFMTESREEFVALKYHAISEELGSRDAIQSELNEQAMLGPQIIKVALISYFNDLQQSDVKLRRNLTEIHRYISGFPNRTGTVSLSNIALTCTETTKCLVVEASKSRRIVWYDLTVAGKRRQLPLYVLGPLTQQETLPLFRLSRNSIRVVDVPR